MMRSDSFQHQQQPQQHSNGDNGRRSGSRTSSHHSNNNNNNNGYYHNNNNNENTYASFSSHHYSYDENNMTLLQRSSEQQQLHQHDEQQHQQQQQVMILHEELVFVSNMVGTFIEQAELTVEDLRKDNNTDLLGNAIIRKCQECADVLDHVANEIQQEQQQQQIIEIEHHHLQNNNNNINNCSNRIVLPNDLSLLSQTTTTATTPTSSSSAAAASDSPTSSRSLGTVSVVSPTVGSSNNNSNNNTTNHMLAMVDDDFQNNIDDEEDVTTILNQISDSSTIITFEQILEGSMILMRDVATSLREIGEHDANEIADVALTVAEMFIISVHEMHSNLVMTLQQHHQQQQNSIPRSTVTIEEINDDDDDDDDDDVDYQNKTRRHSSSYSTEPAANATVPPSSVYPSPRLIKSRLRTPRRQRLIWPPIKPVVIDVCNWSGEQIQNQPLVAAGVGIMVWPIAIPTAIMGGSMVLADDCIQFIYSTSQEHIGIIKNLEEGAAQIVQVSKLSWLVSKLAVKQSLKVVKTQVERQGGIEKVTEHVAGAVVERIQHPIETAGMAWNGMIWGFDKISETIGQVIQQQQELNVAEQFMQ